MSDLSDLFDKPVRVTHAVAVGFWIVGLFLVALELIEGWRTGDLGLFAAGVGGVLTIRGYVCNMFDREIQAFELGRKAGALRSVDR